MYMRRKVQHIAVILAALPSQGHGRKGMEIVKTLLGALGDGKGESGGLQFLTPVWFSPFILQRCHN